LNNPLKYVDPSGHDVYINGMNVEWIDYYLQNIELFYLEGGWEIYEETRNAPMFQAYSQLRKRYSNYSQYLETTVEVFNVTTNNKPSQAELKQIENGANLLRIEAKPSSTNVYEYRTNTHVTFWSHDKGFTWDYRGSWSRVSKGPPVDWGAVGQKFVEADWNALGNAVIGTGELVIGAPLAITGGVLTAVVAISGSAVAEAPVVVTGGIGYIGLMLCVDGINRASGQQLIDIGWLQWPF
jgi:hypothetical protein